MPLHSPPTEPARKLAWKITAWVVGSVLVVGSMIYLSLDQSEIAQKNAREANRGVTVVDRKEDRNTARGRENRRLILGQTKLTRQVQGLVRAQARTVKANRRRIRQQGRVLVRSGLAEMAEGGGIQIRQGAVGAVGATGATGAAGASAPAVTAQQLTDVFAPLLPPAVALLCEGSCDGPAGRDGSDGQDGRDAPPPSQDQVTAAHLALCQSGQIVCAVPGPQGPRGEKGEQGDPGPVATTSTTFDCLPDPDPLAPSGAMVCTARP